MRNKAISSWPMIIAQSGIIAYETKTYHIPEKLNVSPYIQKRYNVLSIMAGHQANFFKKFCNFLGCLASIYSRNTLVLIEYGKPVFFRVSSKRDFYAFFEDFPKDIEQQLRPPKLYASEIIFLLYRFIVIS